MHTTTEAATVLGVQPKTVTRYIERGIIQAEKKGRDYLVSRQELDRFLAKRRKAGRPKKERNTNNEV